MKHIFSILLLTFLYISVSCATVIEHADFASIFHYLTPDDYHKNTVVVLDIDNTIATLGGPFQMLGSDTWVSHEIAKRIKEGMPLQEALEQVLPLYFELVHIVDLKPAEPATIEIIKQLQALGITVIACTLRSLEISDRTIEQLHELGIDLTHSAFGPDEILGNDIIFRYKNGIIFCHGLSKGPAFKCVLDHFNHMPTKVIFIDDKEKYIHQIKDILHPEIEFIGIRYSQLDEKVAQFDHGVAEQELQTYLASA